MRRWILGGMLVLASVLMQPAVAGWVYQFNTDDSLSWRIADHSLKLHSDNATGITVTKVSAERVWGLQEGDVITAVDDHPVKHISELMDWLRASKPATVMLHIRRTGAALALSVAAAEYGRVIAPPPPTPPPPPPPPPMESGWYIYEHNTDDSLSWRIPDHALQLKSGASAGITVTKVIPESLWGLRMGDVITAVDSRPVMHVNELMDRLRASRPTSVKLQIVRSKTLLMLELAATDYGAMVSARSPAAASNSTRPDH